MGKAFRTLIPAMAELTKSAVKGTTFPTDEDVKCTRAGKNYTANLSGTNGVTIKQGVKSTVSLNIKGSTMEVASVGIGEWNSGETISETLE